MTAIVKARPGINRVRDYLELTKPKVVALLVLTAWVGMMLGCLAYLN